MFISDLIHNLAYTQKNKKIKLKSKKEGDKESPLHASLKLQSNPHRKTLEWGSKTKWITFSALVHNIMSPFWFHNIFGLGLTKRIQIIC